VAKGGVPLRLDLRLAPLPDVMGRPSELNEVVTNLILNAIDAMPDGGTLSIYTRPEGDEHVVLTVADTGVGMSEHVRKRIFDPFFTTKGEVGTGLGLSVSYSIIQRHSGEMRVESAAGRGTTFTIVLPVGKAGDAQAPADPEAGVGTRSARILLVDNELPVMTILAEMLTEAGHHVLPVASGAEAVRVFVPSGFDLVMTNLGMTGLTGWDVAERVRASDPQVPVVFITGWGLQAEDRERCRKLGVINVLFKPVRPADLHTAVQEALAASTRKPSGSVS
jgi:CheY-like chemotaxis protein